MYSCQNEYIAYFIRPISLLQSVFGWLNDIMCYVRFTCALLFLSPCIFLKHFSNATLTTHAKINQILSFMEINGKRHLSLTTFDNYDLSVLEFQIKFIEMSKTKNLYSNHIQPNLSLLTLLCRMRFWKFLWPADFFPGWHPCVLGCTGKDNSKFRRHYPP